MSVDLLQTLVNALVLIGVTIIAGSVGLKRFEAIDRKFEAVDRRFEAMDRRFDAVERRIDEKTDALRIELKRDIRGVDDHVRGVDGHVEGVRAELAQTRSDLTYVALAVGAHRPEGRRARGSDG